MSSVKQIEANRTNAKRSTGPKSGAGKARSAMNALKHGFSSQEIVLEGEDAGEFDALRAQLEADPNSVIERELVDGLAALLWRWRRVPVFEAGLIRARRGAITNPPHYYQAYYISEEGKKAALAYLEEFRLEEEDQGQKKPGAPPSLGGARPKVNEPSHKAAAPPSTEVTQLQESSRTTEGAITDSHARDHPDQLSSQATGLALIKDSEDHDTLSKLSRYEAGLLNAITKTLNLIKAIQGSGLIPKRKMK